MKAITLHQPWASLVASGKKTIETRRWCTSWRGDVLICASKRRPVWPKEHLLPRGAAVCIARIVECRAMTQADVGAACMGLFPGAKAWVLEDVRVVPPVPVRGKQRLFEVEWERALAEFLAHAPHPNPLPEGEGEIAQQAGRLNGALGADVNN